MICSRNSHRERGAKAHVPKQLCEAELFCQPGLFNMGLIYEREINISFKIHCTLRFCSILLALPEHILKLKELILNTNPWVSIQNNWVLCIRDKTGAGSDDFKCGTSWESLSRQWGSSCIRSESRARWAGRALGVWELQAMLLACALLISPAQAVPRTPCSSWQDCGLSSLSCHNQGPFWELCWSREAESVSGNIGGAKLGRWALKTHLHKE